MRILEGRCEFALPGFCAIGWWAIPYPQSCSVTGSRMGPTGSLVLQRGWSLCSHLHTDQHRSYFMHKSFQSSGISAHTQGKSSKVFWHLKPLNPSPFSGAQPSALSIYPVLLLSSFNARKPKGIKQNWGTYFYILPLFTHSFKRSSGAESSLLCPYRWWEHALIWLTTASPG